MDDKCNTATTEELMEDIQIDQTRILFKKEKYKNYIENYWNIKKERQRILNILKIRQFLNIERKRSHEKILSGNYLKVS